MENYYVDKHFDISESDVATIYALEQLLKLPNGKPFVAGMTDTDLLTVTK